MNTNVDMIMNVNMSIDVSMDIHRKEQCEGGV